ncbi:hypothetical protein FB45DRAFT_869231 [Roridomyces roridus]|uniref:DUF6533 domain-containing protein n=1 Tax=Roridomyces roridus TaxID=1738132 RepID=A0AAD7BP16_9AGAR|nr:hypothetical protein FB45DRAFT_869231 [Roridomyces roridus]
MKGQIATLAFRGNAGREYKRRPSLRSLLLNLRVRNTKFNPWETPTSPRSAGGANLSVALISICAHLSLCVTQDGIIHTRSRSPSRITRSIFLSGLVILIYDHLLTLNTEIKYIWSSKLRPSTCWFFAFRYLGLVATLVMFLYYFGASDHELNQLQSCLKMEWVWQVLIVSLELLIEVTLALRVAAIYGFNQLILLFHGCHFRRENCSINMFQWDLIKYGEHMDLKEAPGFRGCHAALSRAASVLLFFPSYLLTDINPETQRYATGDWLGINVYEPVGCSQINSSVKREHVFWIFLSSAIPYNAALTGWIHVFVYNKPVPGFNMSTDAQPPRGRGAWSNKRSSGGGTGLAFDPVRHAEIGGRRALAAAAMKGSSRDIAKLRAVVDSLRDDQSLGLLPVIFANLDPAFIPSTDAGLDNVETPPPLVDNAFKMLYALSVVIRRPIYPFETTPDFWPRLFRWMATIMMLLMEHPPSREIIRSAPGGCRMAASAWSIMMQEVYPMTARPTPLAMPGSTFMLLNMTLKSPDDFQEIVDGFSENHTFTSTIFSLMSPALAQASDGDYLGAITLTAICDFLDRVRDLSPTLVADLLSENIIRHLVLALDVLQNPVSNKPLALFTLIRYMISLPGYRWTLQALEADLLLHLINLAERIDPAYEKDVDYLLVQVIAPMLVYYSVVVEMKSSMERAHEHSQSEAFSRSRCYSFWTALKNLAEHRMQILNAWEKAGRPVPLRCDNSQNTQDWASPTARNHSSELWFTLITAVAALIFISLRFSLWLPIPDLPARTGGPSALHIAYLGYGKPEEISVAVPFGSMSSQIYDGLTHIAKKRDLTPEETAVLRELERGIFILIAYTVNPWQLDSRVRGEAAQIHPCSCDARKREQSALDSDEDLWRTTALSEVF